MAQKKIVVDTNIFLEFLLKQQQQEECLDLLLNIERGAIEAHITSFSLHGIEVLLDKRNKTELLEQFLGRVIQARGLKVYQTSPQEEKDIAALANKIGLDFDDALQYYVARTLGAALVSFDKDFDRTDIKRITPLEAMAP